MLSTIRAIRFAHLVQGHTSVRMRCYRGQMHYRIPTCAVPVEITERNGTPEILDHLPFLHPPWSLSTFRIKSAGVPIFAEYHPIKTIDSKCPILDRNATLHKNRERLLIAPTPNHDRLQKSHQFGSNPNHDRLQKSHQFGPNPNPSRNLRLQIHRNGIQT